MGYLEEQLARMEESERKHQELEEANRKAMERREKIKAAYPEAFEEIGSAFNLDKSYADDITKIVSINEGYMSMAELDTMRQSNEIDNALSDGPNMVRLDEFEGMLDRIIKVEKTVMA